MGGFQRKAWRRREGKLVSQTVVTRTQVKYDATAAAAGKCLQIPLGETLLAAYEKCTSCTVADVAAEATPLVVSVASVDVDNIIGAPGHAHAFDIKVASQGHEGHDGDGEAKDDDDGDDDDSVLVGMATMFSSAQTSLEPCRTSTPLKRNPAWDHGGWRGGDYEHDDEMRLEGFTQPAMLSDLFEGGSGEIKEGASLFEPLDAELEGLRELHNFRPSHRKFGTLKAHQLSADHAFARGHARAVARATDRARQIKSKGSAAAPAGEAGEDSTEDLPATGYLRYWLVAAPEVRALFEQSATPLVRKFGTDSAVWSTMPAKSGGFGSIIPSSSLSYSAGSGDRLFVSEPLKRHLDGRVRDRVGATVARHATTNTHDLATLVLQVRPFPVKPAQASPAAAEAVVVCDVAVKFQFQCLSLAAEEDVRPAIPEVPVAEAVGGAGRKGSSGGHRALEGGAAAHRSRKSKSGTDPNGQCVVA